MASTTLMPHKFKGLSNENHLEWWNDVANYCAFKKLDDQGKLGLVPLLLQGGAKYWFQALQPAQRDTFDHLATAFKDHYERPDLTRWRDTALAWGINQEIGQPLEEYISKMQEL